MVEPVALDILGKPGQAEWPISLARRFYYTQEDLTMKTVSILCRHYGELTYTAKSPVREWTSADPVDLTEQKPCIFSPDDFRNVMVNKWEVRPVEVPDWMTGDEYAQHHIQWDGLWTVKGAKDMPQEWQVYLALYVDNPTERLALAKLLAVQNFRSDFRRSLRDQVVTYIETAPDQRKYSRPLSWKQMSALTRWER
jgi:hypothetical protein